MTTSGCCDQLTVASEVRLVRQQCQLELCTLHGGQPVQLLQDRRDVIAATSSRHKACRYVLHGLKALE